MSYSDYYSLSVLVIDDQKSMRSILRSLLKQIGVGNVEEAGGGEEAIGRLVNSQIKFPDLIICDLHMEKMDGLEFCNTVRRSEALRNRSVPILMLTGDRDDLLHEVSKQVGALSVLTKPITAEELKGHISTAVGYSLV